MFNVKIPSFVSEQPENKEIKKVTDIEDKECREFIQDIIHQCFIETATWGLRVWEELYGIPVDANKDIKFRRSVIKSKMRGQSTTTIKNLKNVAESFSNGEVEIIENLDEYTFGIKFVGNRGIPPNMDDLINSLHENIPCYLVYEFIFVYMTWNEFESYNKTFDEWDSLNLTWDELQIYREGKGDI